MDITDSINFGDLIKNELLSINRDGVEKLYNWISNKTDFFSSPASGIYHNNKIGGLCEHSYRVYQILDNLCKQLYDIKGIEIPHDSIVICGILHDICKVNSYQESYRNFKDEETGQWLSYKTYTKRNDAFPYGHGEKSVFIISQFIKLTPIEMLAIRWHMGLIYTSDGEERKTIMNAYNSHPLVAATHIADMMATYAYDEIVDYKKLASGMNK